MRSRLGIACVVLCVAVLDPASAAPPEGFTSLFNGQDLSGWKVPNGDNGHWKVLNGVIDYDAQSESDEDKSLWSDKEYGDFTLLVDWRIKETPYINPRVRVIKPNGEHKKGADGKDIQISVPDSDSGIFLRGLSKAQVNIWCWPVGSGEVYGYRMDTSLPRRVRSQVTPRVNADKDIGKWNTFEITMQGDRLSVRLNNRRVLRNAELPGIPEKGPLALQHHGSMRNGEWTSPPALVQFRNIYIREIE
jgi:hypothetical protein